MQTRAEEAFGLALRTRDGAVVDPAANELVADLAAGGILERIGREAAGTRVLLTRVGRLLGDDVTARLLLAGAAPARTGLALGRLEC